uniref:Macroglobulin domain-containing protein n=1 Tax=Cyprinodon variegatus TaxID=28743 RepID=A0A3Q2DDH6_CYPVA
MGSIRRMHWFQLWLMTLKLFFSTVFRFVMSAPNLLRVGIQENIFIEIQEKASQEDVNVTISAMNHPTKSTTFASTSVTLTKQRNFQELVKLVIPAENSIRQRDVKQYVTLQAQFPGQLLEKVVLVSFQSGYIFIQTDKPIYTPSSKHTCLFQTPGGVVIDFKTISLRSGIYSGNYVLGNIVSFGNWKVVAKFHSHAAESFTAEFEVKEYVLPSFEVKLLPPPESPFFYVDSKELKITIKATYVFGKEVDGSAYVVFGRISGDEKKSFPNSLQRVPIQSGDGEVKLLREHITENIDELVGSSIYVSVSVLTESGKRHCI